MAGTHLQVGQLNTAVSFMLSCLATNPISSPGKAAPPGDPDALPYYVARSKTRNLPVYLDYKHGRTQTTTIVRKIDGDIAVSCGMGGERMCAHCLFLQQMERDLRAYLTAVAKESKAKGEKRQRRATLLTQVDGIVGSIKIHGNHREAIKTWLKRMGF